jgi:hypothetical protein
MEETISLHVNLSFYISNQYAPKVVKRHIYAYRSFCSRCVLCVWSRVQGVLEGVQLALQFHFFSYLWTYVKFLTEHVRIRHNTRWSQADLKHIERNGQ